MLFRSEGFVQAYNAQAAVDAEAQIIVAHELTQRSRPIGALGRGHREQSRPQARAGLSGLWLLQRTQSRSARSTWYRWLYRTWTRQAPGSVKRKSWWTADATDAIDDGGFETPDRLRKQVVEPVFGQIKQARCFRQFLLRGVKKVRAEWAMICTTHNLLKLFTLAKAA